MPMVILHSGDNSYLHFDSTQAVDEEKEEEEEEQEEEEEECIMW
jgi:hypothetical protein